MMNSTKTSKVINETLRRRYPVFTSATSSTADDANDPEFTSTFDGDAAAQGDDTTVVNYSYDDGSTLSATSTANGATYTGQLPGDPTNRQVWTDEAGKMMMNLSYASKTVTAYSIDARAESPACIRNEIAGNDAAWIVGA